MERGLSLDLPSELLDALAARLADRIAAHAVDAVSGYSPWMTVAEAAEYLRWPRERLYKLTAAGAIPHRKHDGRLLFHRDEVDEWLEAYREGPVPFRRAESRRSAV